MKYLLVKGWLGFGDRLETLKMCVKYAIDRKLAIYVDWTDSIWCHEKESFYTYFSLNLPTFSIDELPEDIVVHPPYWKNRLHDKLTKELALEKKQELDVGFLNDKINFDCDLLVISSIGVRHTFNDSTFFANVFKVKDTRIIQRVKQRQQQYDLSKKWGIHLRGSDRTSTREFKVKRISELGLKLINFGLLNGLKLVAVTDDSDYLALWKAKFSDHPVLTEVGALGGREGVHNKKDIPITKDELNVDMLTDFFTLASCSRVLSTSADSRFAKEAQRLHPVLSKIL